MSWWDLYCTIEKFRGYVDRYRKTRKISAAEALTHRIVQLYIEEGEKEGEQDGTQIWNI